MKQGIWKKNSHKDLVARFLIGGSALITWYYKV